jgi:hypothetical protein
MPQLIDGRICRSDNIALGQVCGTENAVARGVPGPALPNEALNLGSVPLRAYADQVRADGAVAYWRLNESSGLVAKDSLGSNNGTISGGVTLNQSGALVGDAAMGFNLAGPAAGQVAVPVGSYSAIGTGAATLECWMRAINAMTGTSEICGTSDIFTTGLILMVDTSFVKLRVIAGGSVLTEPLTAQNLVTDGVWHHVVGVRRVGAPDTAELWIDGVLKQATTFVTGQNLTATTSGYIGASAAAFEFTGGVDDVAVYPLALTPTQIALHYRAGVMVNENIRVGVPGPNPEIP